MKKFIITFQVILDGKRSEFGTVGTYSGTTDYNPNEVKDTVIRHYRILNPGKQVAVKIHDVKLASDKEFNEASKKFLS